MRDVSTAGTRLKNDCSVGTLSRQSRKGFCVVHTISATCLLLGLSSQKVVMLVARQRRNKKSFCVVPAIMVTSLLLGLYSQEIAVLLLYQKRSKKSFYVVPAITVTLLQGLFSRMIAV